ncbi:hypothetical protein HK098_005956 [Nowakowskiella sp. JEL0407]|nr:hypothetical protein HK098_005956 [Nowakowskiella sp. JEL0407]
MTSKFVSVIVNDEEGNQLQQSLSDSSSASGYNLFSPNRQPKDTQIISQFFDLQLEIRTQIHDIEKMQEFVELLREHLIALIAKKKQETSEIQNRHPKDINNSPSFDVLHLNQKNLKLRSTSRNSGNDEAEDVQTKIHMKPTNAEKQLEMFSSRLLAENQNTAGSNPFFFGKGVSRDDLLRGSRQFSVPSKLDVNHIRDTRQTLEARSNDEIVKTGQMQKSFEVSDKSIPMNTIDEDAHQSSESITMPRNMKPLDQSRTSQKATINPLFANRPDIAARLGTDIQSAKYKKSQNSSESLFKSSSRQVSVESQLASNNSSSYSISNYQRIISSRDASRVGSRTGSSEFPTVRNIAHTGSSDLESLRNFKRESTTTRPSDFSVHGANSRRFSKQMSSISDIGTRRASQFEGSMDLARASVTRYLPKGILGSTGEFQHPRASSARRASKLMSATSDSTTSMERSIHKLGNSIVRVQNVEMEIESESEEDELDEFLDNVMEQKPLKQIVYDFFRNEAYTKSGRRIHKFDYVDEKVSKISGFGVHQRSMCRTLWDFFISCKLL